jgi:hypothetical protein
MSSVRKKNVFCTAEVLKEYLSTYLAEDKVRKDATQTRMNQTL